MNCMKCGVQIGEDQVFCDHCLSVMDQYPVKPDTHIHLPKRALSPEAVKKPGKKKRMPTQEEIISSLRLRVLRLRLLAVILAFVVCVLGSFLALDLYEEYTSQFAGRNYRIDITID